MRSTLWIALLTFALSLGAFGNGARAGVLPMPADCCETLCHDLPGCANMLMCQACSAPTAHLAQQRVLDFPHRLSFPHLGNDRTPTGPVSQIWTPPD